VNDSNKGKPKYSRVKTCPSILSTINLTWAYLRSTPGLRGERQATNRLSLGTATKINRHYLTHKDSVPTSQGPLRFHYKGRSANAVWGNNSGTTWNTYIHWVRRLQDSLMLNVVVHAVTAEHCRVNKVTVTAAGFQSITDLNTGRSCIRLTLHKTAALKKLM
jgi:hypothetical protein